jgi:hypothetical protein
MMSRIVIFGSAPETQINGWPVVASFAQAQLFRLVLGFFPHALSVSCMPSRRRLLAKRRDGG